MTGAGIAKALGGRKVGDSWIAPCPAHDDNTPSLSIRDANNGIVLVRCHAGCGQMDVIAALRSRALWPEKGASRSRSPARVIGANDPRHSEDTKSSKAALSIWQSATLADGSLLETYFAFRGLHLSLPSTIRFHSGLKHPSGGLWPAMIALVTSGKENTPAAIHRTFLARDGTGKAPVNPPKMMLGPCRGGAVRLAEVRDTLLLGEGIETCLSAAQATGHAAWAALSTSGLRALDLPYAVRDVIILADGDVPGEAAARRCALRLKREGRRVRIACAPKGMDFNDVLLGRALRSEENAG
jgi:putative DNA primase/helicase